MDWFNDWDTPFNAFVAFYPEVEVLIIKDVADGDYSIDLNDSTVEYPGNPALYAVSPDRQWRINGYYSGGAVDSEIYWLEKWNQSKDKYEYIHHFDERYSADWFWTDNDTVLFKSYNGGEYYYEMKVVVK